VKVTLSIAGGLAPSVMGGQHAVDDRNLSDEQRRALTNAVDAALAEPPRSPGRARDARSYEITIESDTAPATIVAYDGAMPPAVKHLIDLIKTQSR
jgi:Emfourin